jgi:cytochrome c peroxidase
MGKLSRISILLTISLALLFNCGKKEQATDQGKEPAKPDVFMQKTSILGLPPVPIPKDNLQNAEKIALGKKLYQEKKFSGDGTVSCATCHDPNMAFTDRLSVSQGIKKQKGTRNAPTVINAVYLETQFWDGRRPTLEEQAKDPFLNPIEHGLKSHSQIIDVIRADKDYLQQFKKVFQVDAGQINIDHVVQAIASFERTAISGNSPFDRYLYGGDPKALSPAAIRGLELYRTKARCQDCHKLTNEYAIFTDHKFHNLGVGFDKIGKRIQSIVEKFRESKMQSKEIDEKALASSDISELGRFAITLQISDVGAFKTPTLRNVAKTAPYMHDGSHKTLQEVIELYNRGGNKNQFLSNSIQPLNLTAREKADLLEFLNSLTSPEFSK